MVVIGGVAAGASAAARARRHSETASIVVLERGPHVSFANCGLPYHIGGEIAERSRLELQSPASLRDLLQLDVRVRHEAVAIHRESREVEVRRLEDGATYRLPYDRLIFAPGASPVRPPLPGIDDPRIHTLRNLEDMDRVKRALEGASEVLVVGAGFIGLEMAEQLRRLDKRVTLVELQPQVLPQMDPEMAAPIEAALRAAGVRVILDDGIASFTAGVERVTAQLKRGTQIEADAVILSIGVRPE